MMPAQAPDRTALRHLLIPAAISAVAVLLLYLWIVSRGTWLEWPARTNYYSLQASSFNHGKLALDLQPDPALLALPDPYASAARANVRFPLDVSLYQGKFYLYFGPVPALLLMLPRALYPGEIGDQFLVFLFACGIFICLSLILIKLWRRYFPDIPIWMVVLGILLVGLEAPFDAVLNGSAIYEAAITGGQLFFLAGLYWALDTLEPAASSKWKLALTGALWAAALGCRITLIIPVALMALMLFPLILRNSPRTHGLSGPASFLLSFAVPLALGLAALGWYNWVRFASPLETGIAYQLAGPNLQKHRQDIFSARYTVQNIYNYVFNAPKRQPTFPYILFAPGKVKPVRSSVSFPRIYDAERMTGILYTAPFAVFSIIPALAAAIRLPRRLARQEADPLPIRWITVGLYAFFFAGLIFFLVFFWAAERYLIDFFPSLLLLSILGFWQLSKLFETRPLRRMLYASIGIALAVISIIVSTLLALGKTPLR